MPNDDPTPEELLWMHAPKCRVCNDLATRRGVPAEHNTTYIATLGVFTKIFTLLKMRTFDQVTNYLKPWEDQIHNAFPGVPECFVIEVLQPGRGPFYCDYCDGGWYSYEDLPIIAEVRAVRRKPKEESQKTRFDRILEDD